MTKIYRVNEFIRPDICVDAAIKACIDTAKRETPFPTVVLDGGDYILSEAILLPPGITVILDGCRIKQGDYVADNVFRGDNVIPNPEDPFGMPLSCGKTHDITIVGKHGACISGPDRNRIGYHPVLDEEQEMVGDFWGWRTISVSLSNCDRFEISGIHFEKSRCWTMSFDRCRHGYIHDIEFNTDVKNGDGIDFRSGCHDCTVENITGVTSDDTVACTALGPFEGRTYPNGKYLYPLEPSLCVGGESREDYDISHITIKNIHTGGSQHGVICLAADGHRVYDIHIDGVIEPEGEYWREATVKIYTGSGYGQACREGDMSRITVENVQSVYADCPVLCCAPVTDGVIRNIRHANGAGGLCDKSSQ